MRFHVTDHTGHSTMEFIKGDKVSMAEAEQRFMELTGKGFRAAEKVGGDTKMPPPGQQKFNPDADEVVFVRPIQGG